MMTNIPDNLRYSEDDEWMLLDGDEAIVGITDFAQDQLSDIVYLELPGVGETFDSGDVFGVVESVKAASDLLMPVAGEVIAVNESLVDTPELLNEDPFGAAWLVRIKMADPDEADELMSAEDYAEHIEARS